TIKKLKRRRRSLQEPQTAIIKYVYLKQLELALEKSQTAIHSTYSHLAGSLGTPFAIGDQAETTELEEALFRVQTDLILQSKLSWQRNDLAELDIIRNTTQKLQRHILLTLIGLEHRILAAESHDSRASQLFPPYEAFNDNHRYFETNLHKLLFTLGYLDNGSIKSTSEGVAKAAENPWLGSEYPSPRDIPLAASPLNRSLEKYRGSSLPITPHNAENEYGFFCNGALRLQMGEKRRAFQEYRRRVSTLQSISIYKCTDCNFQSSIEEDAKERERITETLDGASAQEDLSPRSSVYYNPWAAQMPPENSRKLVGKRASIKENAGGPILQGNLQPRNIHAEASSRVVDRSASAPVEVKSIDTQTNTLPIKKSPILDNPRIALQKTLATVETSTVETESTTKATLEATKLATYPLVPDLAAMKLSLEADGQQEDLTTTHMSPSATNSRTSAKPNPASDYPTRLAQEEKQYNADELVNESGYQEPRAGTSVYTVPVERIIEEHLHENQPDIHDSKEVEDRISAIVEEQAQQRAAFEHVFTTVSTRFSAMLTLNSVLPSTLRTMSHLPEGLASGLRALGILEPPLDSGKKRIHWTCRCGYRDFDDFIELIPGAVADHERFLRQHFGDRNQSNSKPSRGMVAGALGLLSNVFGSIGNSKFNRQMRLPQFQPKSTPGIHTSRPSSPTPDSLFLLLCIPYRKFATKLLHIELNKTVSDRDFFSLLQRNHEAMKGVLRSWLSLKTLQAINRRHPARQSRGRVPYQPIPAALIPPIGEKHLMHLCTHPEDADDAAAVCLARIPKKLKERLFVDPASGTGVGWGVHFVEGWQYSAVWHVAFVTLLLASVVFLTCWALFKQDVQGASGVAAYMLAFMTLAVGSLQAALELN
ncbi:hypothetical protein MMC11_007251, partial [Xylographa trunciseda]|nr:hypothetical protein [Xylographa trunciseda]